MDTLDRLTIEYFQWCWERFDMDRSCNFDDYLAEFRCATHENWSFAEWLVDKVELDSLLSISQTCAIVSRVNRYNKKYGDSLLCDFDVHDLMNYYALVVINEFDFDYLCELLEISIPADIHMIYRRRPLQ